MKPLKIIPTDERIKAVRKAVGLSQSDFAIESGLSPSQLQKLESRTVELSDKAREMFNVRWNLKPHVLDLKVHEPDLTDLFTVTPEKRLSKQGAIVNPWREEAYAHLKEEIKYYRELLTALATGKRQ